jgi:hypothetical protein
MSGLSPDGHQAGSSNGWPPAHEAPAPSIGTPANGSRADGSPPNGNAVPGNGHVTNGAEGLHGPSSPCTAAQLRRFIKSRPYVPMHELRRRFELNGDADEVTPIHAGDAVVYLGLQPRESHLIEDLIRQGEIGLELAYDPQVPIVIGVYPMRPISRT